MFKCDICESEFKSKRNLTNHLNKKNKCNVITPFKCLDCNKYFKYNKSLQEHIIKQTCKDDKYFTKTNIKAKIELPDYYKTIQKMIESKTSEDIKIPLIKNLVTLEDTIIKGILDSNDDNDTKITLLLSSIKKNNPTGVSNNINNITNSNNNITNNFQINNFGKENLSYMDNEYFKNLILNQHIEKGYIQLIKDIYLNKDHPENNTVKVENLNNKYAHIYNNGKWDAILKADLKEQLHKKNYTILKMYYDKFKKQMTMPKKEETRVFLQRDDFSDPHMMYVIDKIVLLFYNDGEGEDITETGKINKNIV
jgi:hypothetical protein